MPLDGGSATFDQTLRLKVNMYFDTVKSKFVEKKVRLTRYSACIASSSGPKRARRTPGTLPSTWPSFSTREYTVPMELRRDGASI